MKKMIVLIVLILSLMGAGISAGQGLPDLSAGNSQNSAVLPDPGVYLSSAGDVLQRNYRYNGVVYDTYLYAAPESESEFLTYYYIAAADAGFQPELAFVEQNKAMKIYDQGRTGDPALLMYDYQGYVLLMVPLDMNFTPGPLPASTPKPTSFWDAKPTPTRTPTAVPSPTSFWDVKPTSTRTPTRVPTATKTPKPTATRDPNAGYEKYRVTGAGIYGFQIRPYPNTDWFFKEQYQHPVYNGDIVYFTGDTQNGPGYDYANIKWMSVRIPDGFTGWLPAYILTKTK